MREHHGACLRSGQIHRSACSIVRGAFATCRIAARTPRYGRAGTRAVTRTRGEALPSEAGPRNPARVDLPPEGHHSRSRRCNTNVDSGNQEKNCARCVQIVLQGLHAAKRKIEKSRQRDLNPQPQLYESCALPLSYVGVRHRRSRRRCGIISDGGNRCQNAAA